VNYIDFRMNGAMIEKSLMLCSLKKIVKIFEICKFLHISMHTYLCFRKCILPPDDGL